MHPNKKTVKISSASTTTIMSLFAAGLSGCGGGSSGNVVKGPLHNATVFFDANNNGLLDSGEVSTTADVNGYYSFTSDGSGKLTAIATGSTIDTLSGSSVTNLILSACRFNSYYTCNYFNGRRC